MNAFVDTNILVYAADETTPLPPKTQVARELLLQPGLHLSVQVLSEFVVTARSPHKLDFDPVQEREWMERWLLFPVAPIRTATFLGALSFHQRFQLSHWDAMILASAADSGCTLVYSEDLSETQDYDGMRVVNPFRL